MQLVEQLVKEEGRALGGTVRKAVGDAVRGAVREQVQLNLGDLAWQIEVGAVKGAVGMEVNETASGAVRVAGAARLPGGRGVIDRGEGRSR